MKNQPLRGLLLFIFFVTGFFGVGHFLNQGYSANLTSVSVTLSNSRPSFRGALAAGNTAGSSTVVIDTTPGDYPSTSSAQLVQGDVVLIGNAGSLGSYTVASTSSESTFSLTAGLAAGDADTADDVVATSSTTLTARFTTASAVANGRFRILVPALDSDTASADGIPDGGYYDFGSSAPTVTCPSDISGYDFVTGTATASTITVGSVQYHSFECAYSGTGAVSSAFDGTTNGAIVINSVINPAPAAGHTTGTADTYSVIVQQLNSSFAVVDRTITKVGVIEAVKVTASVAPSITFKILGLNSATAACGISGGTSVTTTAATVPFGTLSIADFTTAAQALSVSTNATNGYTVTAVANDQLGKDGATCTGDSTSNTCIRDAAGDTAAMTHSVSDEWVTASNDGFAYSLQDINSTTTEAFAYNESARTFSARQFADAEDGQSPVTIFSDTTVAQNDNLYVCYKIIPTVLTASGDYENYITYTATATF